MTIEQLYDIYLKHSIVTTDSRNVAPGSLFFALKGEHFDGNQYAAQALEKGAAYAIVDNPTFVGNDQFLLVKDVLQCLQELARHHRRQFDLPVIAITGSNGKTTTKELVSAVLSSQYQTHFTKGNLNNHIGVPLTLLAMPEQTDVAIIEMGANHLGEIDALCHIAEPTHGLITNIGKAHLEGFGSLEGVKKAKSELYRYLAKKNGVAFVNKNENWLEELSAPVQKKIYYFKSEQPDSKKPDYEVVFVAAQPFVEIAFLDKKRDMVKVQSQLIGEYNFNNIMTAVALGKYFKVPAKKIKEAIISYIPQNNRSQIIHQNDNTYILDAYNANPGSMREAILNLTTLDANNKIAILGDMLELGKYSEAEHLQIANLALKQGFDQLVLIGKEFGRIKNKANFIHFESVVKAKDWWGNQKISNAHILIKGSRGLKLEALINL